LNNPIKNVKKLLSLYLTSVFIFEEHKRTDSVERIEPLDIRNEEKFRKIREILGGERKRDQGSRDSLPLLKKKCFCFNIAPFKPELPVSRDYVRTVQYNSKVLQKIYCQS